jgi:nitric oxide reductase subunit B
VRDRLLHERDRALPLRRIALERALHPALAWPDRLLRFAFWAINLGLAAMLLISLLPVGLLQTWAAVSKGYWYAGSEEFLHTPVIDTLRWLRAIGDTVFAAGAFAFVTAVVRMTVARRRAHRHADADATHPAA